MERYLSNPRGERPKSGPADLLSLLKGKKQEKLSEDKSSSSSSAEMEWKTYESKNVNVIDVECDIKAGILKNKSYVGWKMNGEGNRVYTTFRSGQRVQGQGHEAFKLALGDGKIKNKKRKVTEIVEINELNNIERQDKTSKTRRNTTEKGKESELHPYNHLSQTISHSTHNFKNPSQNL